MMIPEDEQQGRKEGITLENDAKATVENEHQGKQEVPDLKIEAMFTDENERHKRVIVERGPFGTEDVEMKEGPQVETIVMATHETEQRGSDEENPGKEKYGDDEIDQRGSNEGTAGPCTK